MAERVYWGTVKFKECILYLVATDLGLALVTWPDESFEAVEDFVQNRLPGRVLTRDPLKLKTYKDALHQYLEYGRVDIHELSLDLQGTDFQIAVWQALIDIPAGQTRTYSDIAQRIGRQDAVRAVAHAIGVNPIPFLIPCHRVIGKDGNLTGYRGGLLLKESLLQLEGFLPKEPEYYL
ncbi:methylated-DNA--[protein]-cysteine S-methyltransferase [Alicyclobacillus suci]|uniref:methylated-DNA--[protein]-cysteine S-methyltransferase n=1 Tax=Alicyclobacillus suci TaxID=2816080 RepID=UPI001A8E65BC|nr:methylated-DNA--[protein]-cysteine S-methyltransferase [Alicyclobacillus suci]